MNGGQAKQGGFKIVTKAQAQKHMSRDERIQRMEGAVIPLETEEEFIETIERLWRDAQGAFLTIGRYLIQAQSKLGMEEKTFKGFVESKLPFGYQTAYQLCKVAAAIDGHVLAIEEVPPSYATVYLFATMEPEDLAEARSMAPPLLRPNVTRKEVAEFKRQKEQARLLQASPSEVMRKTRERLRRNRATLQKRRDAIDAQLAELDRLLQELG